VLPVGGEEARVPLPAHLKSVTPIRPDRIPLGVTAGGSLSFAAVELLIACIAGRESTRPLYTGEIQLERDPAR